MSAINNNPTPAQLMAMIEQLKAENAKLKAQPVAKKSIKAGPAGTVVMNGYGKFPKSFFKSEILDILARAEEIKSWIVANDSALSGGKDDTRFEASKLAAAQAWAARSKA